MSEPNQPSPWRLFWSPYAMAWYAVHRKQSALRLTTLLIGVTVGLFLNIGQYADDEPVVAPLSASVPGYVFDFMVLVVLIHGWSWLVPRRMALGIPRRPLAAGMAAVPWVSLWAVFWPVALYHNLVQDANIADYALGWPELPHPIPRWLDLDAYPTPIWAGVIWFILFPGAPIFWLLHAFFAGRIAVRIPIPELDPVCPSCSYNLTGTFAANRTQCPECGAGVTPPSDTASQREA